MSPDKVLVIVIGSLLIAFIWWFFFGNKETEAKVLPVKNSSNTENASFEIVVDGGYKPAVIFLTKGVRTTLNITRKDPNSCLGDIILPDFKISKYLPVNQEVKIELNPEKSGEFPFHCGMNMFHGKLVVE